MTKPILGRDFINFIGKYCTLPERVRTLIIRAPFDDAVTIDVEGFLSLDESELDRITMKLHIYDLQDEQYLSSDTNKKPEELIKYYKELEQEAIDRMKGSCFFGDQEIDHGHADDILCDALRKLGFDDLVDLYETVDKWYA